MGPLVYYCRWREAKLRLRGREGPLVWGELALRDAEDESDPTQPFRFNTVTGELFLQREDGWARLQLDELGVIESESTVSDDALPPMTSAGALPQ